MDNETRGLSQEEIDLINDIKSVSNDLENILARLKQANANAHWCAIAKIHVEQGTMALCRSLLV